MTKFLVSQAIKKKATLRVWILFIIVVCCIALLFLDWYSWPQKSLKINLSLKIFLWSRVSPVLIATNYGCTSKEAKRKAMEYCIICSSIIWPCFCCWLHFRISFNCIVGPRLQQPAVWFIWCKYSCRLHVTEGGDTSSPFWEKPGSAVISSGCQLVV